MGSGTTPVNGLPPLPPGAKLQQPAAAAAPPGGNGLPALPPGAKLTSTGAAPPPAPATDLTSNPRNEGLYQMEGPTGKLSIPYSKVSHATKQGYSLTEDDNDRYTKDAANDPIKQLGELNTGFTSALSQTGHTAEKALTKLPILGKILASSKGFQESMAADEERANKPLEAPAEIAGATIENILEFAAGDEALKGLSLSQKLAKLGPVAKFMEANPRIAEILGTRIAEISGNAARTGTVAAGQAAAHGADTGQALTTGAVTGAAGGLLEGVLAGAGKLASRTAPAVEEIAGEPVQTLSSQRPGEGARGSVKPNEVPKVTKAQQAAAPRVFRNIAQRSTRDAIEEANVGRTPERITDPQRLLGAPEDAQPYSFTIEGPGATSEDLPGGNEPRKKQIGTEFVPGKGSANAAKSEPYNEGGFKYGDQEPLPVVHDQEPFTGPTHKEPIFQYLTSLKPGEEIGSTRVSGGGDLVAANPETAQAHLSRLNDLVDHPPEGASPAQVKAITEARDNLQEQMDVYHSYQRTLPNFHPIDAGRVAENVGSFGEAADQLQNAATPIYQKMDEATGNKFGRLNRLRKAAGKRGDFDAKFDYEDQIRKLIDNTPGVSNAEREQATRLWSKSAVLDSLHDVVEHAANVSDKYAAQVAGGRVLSGSRMQNGLQRLISRYGQERLESVIGREGMENMTRIADLLNVPKKQAGLKAMGLSVVHAIAHGKVGGVAGASLGHHLFGYEGALLGGMAGAHAERWILQRAATSPRIGQLLDYAIRNDVTPKVAAPLIASAIMQEQQSEQQQEKEEGKDEQ